MKTLSFELTMPNRGGGGMTCKLTYTQKLKMAQDALWAEEMYIELNMFEQAARYGRIWARIMCNLIAGVKK